MYRRLLVSDRRSQAQAEPPTPRGSFWQANQEAAGWSFDDALSQSSKPGHTGSNQKSGLLDVSAQDEERRRKKPLQRHLGDVIPPTTHARRLRYPFHAPTFLSRVLDRKELCTHP